MNRVVVEHGYIGSLVPTPFDDIGVERGRARLRGIRSRCACWSCVVHRRQATIRKVWQSRPWLLEDPARLRRVQRIASRMGAHR